ncbi:alpha/beta fold hydrolase [Glutamicibacter protophormiae]|nr:alpha/beta fold hydrolase [Glutamicibacter protophormiae]
MTPPSTPPPSRGRRFLRRTGRLLRRAVLVGVVGLVLLTLLSVVGNAVTTPPDTLEPDAGAFTDAGGLAVHYEHWAASGKHSSGDAAPVVLLPGFAESTVAFRAAAPLIAAQGRDVYAFDLPGFGYTRGGDTEDVRSQADLVAGTIRTLGIDHPVVVGHSLGAAVAGGTALWHPEDVGGVVFADGDAQDLDFGDGTWRARIARLPYTTSVYRIFTRSTWLNRAALAGSCGSACTAFDGDDGARLARQWMRPLTQGDVEHSLLGSAGHSGILHLEEDQTRAITVPRAIIWGAEDTRSGGSLQDTRDRLGHPQERIVDGAAHDVMNAQPGAFADALGALTDGMDRR